MCKSKRLKSTCFLIALACMLTSPFCGAKTIVIYSDDFSGIGALNGKAPGMRPAQETWIAAEVFGADGTVSANTLDGYTYQAWLPFSPDTGKTYTLSLDVDPQASTDPTTWFALGFSNSNVTASSEDDDQFWMVGVAWILHRVTRAREENDEIQTFLGPGMTEVQSHESKEEGMVTLSVVLDTTASQWTVEWFRNDQSIRGPVAFATNPEISYVGFTKFWVTAGIVDNFELELYEDRFASVPSPHDGAKDVPPDVVLTWKPGSYVEGLSPKHKVFFSKKFEHVRDGIGGVEQDVERYPVSGTLSLDLGETYYWRVNEANRTTGWDEGTVWQFTVADYLVVDDFEDYSDYPPDRIFDTWQDHSTNNSGATVGYSKEPYAEQTIIHKGQQSMPFEYLNDGSTGKALYSETERAFESEQDWTKRNVKAVTLWFRGLPPSVGSFGYDAVTDIYTMTADGSDIFDTADEFHYAFKRLSGLGTIETQVLSVTNTNAWAKAGVMIRETLDPNSAFAAVYISPANGCRFQARLVRGDDATSDTPITQLAHIQAPHWVKLERAAGNAFNAYDSNDPASEGWHPLAWNPQTITMADDVYIGLALTSHNDDPTVVCTAKFSDVLLTGTVTGQWQSQDIGITSNDAEQLYMAVEDSTGKSKVVNHPDPDVVLLDTWQEWNIDLKQVSNAGVNLKSVKKLYIGVGDQESTQPGGKGILYVDDIRLYPPRCLPLLLKPAGDLSGDDCVIDYSDIEILAKEWLDVGDNLSADMDDDSDVDFADYAVLADTWLDKLLWPLP